MAVEPPDARTRKFKRIERVMAVILLSCFVVAVVGAIVFDVSPEQNPWLLGVLGPTMVVAGVGLLGWCRSYTTFTVQKNIERARHIYEGLSGPIQRRFIMSERFWLAQTVFLGLFLVIAGFAALAFLMKQ